ncbi:50S ribosomal protein L33, partial [Dysosmobacter welbionis]
YRSGRSAEEVRRPGRHRAGHLRVPGANGSGGGPVKRRPIHRRRGGGESGSVPRGGGDGVPPDGDALAGQDH